MKSLGPKILIFKNRALGDAIISLGAVQYLRKNMPDVEIIYGVPSWVYPLFSKLETSADKVVPINLKDFSSWLEMYGTLKSFAPDIILELFQSGRGKKFCSLYQMVNSQTIYYGNNHHLDDGTYKKSNIQRDMDGIKNHLPEIPTDSYLNFCPTVSLKDSVNKTNTIIFGIVATRETKLWPIKHYHELANILVKNIPGINIKIPVSGNTFDQRLKRDFLSLGNISQVSFLETSLEELPEEIAAAKAYIGNDTGIKHLAIALGLSSFSFFGPEPPVEWHPYDQEKHPYFYIEGLECRTRDAHFCGLSTCESMVCLNQITAESVYTKISSKLQELMC